MDNNNFHIAKFNNKTKLPQLQIVDNFEFNNSKILDKTAYGNFGYRDTVDKPMDTQVDYQMYEPFYDSDDSESNSESDSEKEENNGIEGFRGRRRKRHRRRRIFRRRRSRPRRRIFRRRKPRRRIFRRPARKIQRKTPKYAPHDIRNYIGKDIRFRTAFKKYITMLPNGRVGSEFANDRNIFKVVDGRNGTIAFHNKTYNVFLRAHAGGFLDRSGRRNVHQLPHNWGWERFKIFFRHGGYYIETFHKTAILVHPNGNVIQGKLNEGVSNANPNRIWERLFIEHANQISTITRDEQKRINDEIALKLSRAKMAQKEKERKEKIRLDKIRKERERKERIRRKKIKKEKERKEQIKKENKIIRMKKTKAIVLKTKKGKQQKIKDALKAKRIAEENKEDKEIIDISEDKKDYIKNKKLGKPLKKEKDKNMIQEIQKSFESLCTIL